VSARSSDGHIHCRGERAQPLRPIGLRYVEGGAHDSVRHGTTMLFVAVDVADGQVFTRCTAWHRYQELLSSLRHIEAKLPNHLDVHLVVDNDGTDKHARVQI
jgi:putative transposase